MTNKKQTLDIENVAKLSKLTLTDEEKKTFGPQLSEVIAYFEKLQEVNTDNVKPTFHVVEGLANRFQEQELEVDTLPQKDVLKNAPQTKDGYVATDKVL